MRIKEKTGTEHLGHVGYEIKIYQKTYNSLIIYYRYQVLGILYDLFIYSFDYLLIANNKRSIANLECSKAGDVQPLFLTSISFLTRIGAQFKKNNLGDVSTKSCHQTTTVGRPAKGLSLNNDEGQSLYIILFIYSIHLQYLFITGIRYYRYQVFCIIYLLHVTNNNRASISEFSKSGQRRGPQKYHADRCSDVWGCSSLYIYSIYLSSVN